MPRISGKDGFLDYGTSNYSDVRRISVNTEANIPEFGTSETGGHKDSVTGVKRFDASADLVLNTDDAPYVPFRVGDTLTLLVHENTNRRWSFPVRVKSIGSEIDIDDGGEVTIAITFSPAGAWTYPDGTLSVN